MRQIRAFRALKVAQRRSAADIQAGDEFGSTCTRCLLVDPFWLHRWCALQQSLEVITGESVSADRSCREPLVSGEGGHPAYSLTRLPLCFRRSELAADLGPALTSVRVRYERLGRTAVRLVLERGERIGGGDHVVLSTELVIRQSVREPR